MPFPSEKNKKQFESDLQESAKELNQARDLLSENGHWLGECGHEDIAMIFSCAFDLIGKGLKKMKALADEEKIKLKI